MIQEAMNLLGTGLQIAGAVSNYGAQKDQQRKQESDRSQQLYDQSQAEALAQQLQRQGLATQVDANGNVQYYDRNTNAWRVALSDIGQKQQDASNRGVAQQGQAGTDAFAQSVVNARRQVGDGQTAGAMHTQLNDAVAGRGTVNPETLAANSRMASRETLNAGMQPVESGLLSQALRSGQGGIEGLTQALTKARTQAAGSVVYNPNEAIAGAQDLNSKRMSDFISNYGAMSGRASQMGGSGSVSGPGDDLTSALLKIRGQADTDTANANAGMARASQIGVNANGMNTLNNADAQFLQGLGNTISSNSGGISSFISKMGKAKSGGFNFAGSDASAMA